MRISRKTHLCSELCLAYASHNDLDFVRTQRNRVLFRQIVLLRPRHENINLQNSKYLHECPAVMLSCA